MKFQFLAELRNNLDSLIRQSGMSVEQFASAKQVPKEVLDRALTCKQSDPELAADLALLSEKLGLTVAQLLSPGLSSQTAVGQVSLPQNNSTPPDHLLARQLGRLIEDFVECDESGRFEVTALAQELAEEQLRQSGKRIPGKSASNT